jgi:hypothetical protein
MRNLFVFGWILCLLASGRARAADSAEKTLVTRLLATAKTHPSLSVRASALDLLAKIGTKDPDALKQLKTTLQELLKKRPLGEDDIVLLPYVVQAIGSLGPMARDILPDLVELRGRDRNLDSTIDTAVASLKSTPASRRSIKDLQGDLQAAFDLKEPTDDDVNTLKAILIDKKSATSTRVLAAKALGIIGKKATSALETLQGVANESGVDEDLKSVATNAIKKIKGT